jgi:hypothetical protein
MSNLVQCNICQRWYSNQHGLLIHLRYCRERHSQEQTDGNHLLIDFNPLKSCNDKSDHLDPFSVYEDVEESTDEDSNNEDYFNIGIPDDSTN